MRLSDKWKDYELIDTSDGERLERVVETLYSGTYSNGVAEEEIKKT